VEEHILEFEKPIYDLQHKIDEIRKSSKKTGKIDVDREVALLEEKITELRAKIYSELKPFEKMQVARHPLRPFMLDYVNLIFKDFIELHGDRRFADDQAIVGGFATLQDRRVMVIGHQRGRDVKENIKRNFGQANPEGYRKALRLMELAEKFRLPVITFVDTQGAYPGLGGEERGQAEAIAYNLKRMSSLRTPIITVIIGEGGSGGALGIAVSDVVMMLEHSIYSVISPEGCAAILWNDSTKAREAAEALNITADKLYDMGVIDEIIKEPVGGAHIDPKATALSLKDHLLTHLKRLSRIPVGSLTRQRYRKFRRLGEFYDNGRLVTSKRRA
jgi:acetyl-CoA carboxylase carboxyl transferase subunit alpha